MISGCSGGGKSTLLRELARRGYRTVDEPGRRVVEHELATGGNALPWADAPAFANNCANLAAADIAAASHTPGPSWTFFDRGLVDAAIAIRHYTGTDATISLDALRSYHHRVFFTPPWEAIWSTDDARRHSLAEATAEYERLTCGYKELGYQITVLPRTSVNDWVDQTLRELHAQRTQA
ncbi:AAA family ATPase [Gordonia sp. CPCC 205515]|uniref:AAA family ATPase n=1 Tax=Gordonia sp. CPCC 205515 TaxID=3140791 RepID=UPI003AF3BC9F